MKEINEVSAKINYHKELAFKYKQLSEILHSLERHRKMAWSGGLRSGYHKDIAENLEKSAKLKREEIAKIEAPAPAYIVESITLLEHLS